MQPHTQIASIPKNPENDTVDSRLLRIAHYLTLNASFLRDISLCHGKMGIAIFFFHYSRYCGDSVYMEYAWDLIEEVYRGVHDGLPVNFENGLCGIGFGIEYLVQNRFMEGDTGEVLGDLNRLIMERDPRRIKDTSFEKGLGGIYYYVSVHTYSPFNLTPTLDAAYHRELQQAINNLDISVLGMKGYPAFNSLQPLAFPPYMIRDKVELKEEVDITRYALGVAKGLSGIGLQLMGV